MLNKMNTQSVIVIQFEMDSQLTIFTTTNVICPVAKSSKRSEQHVGEQSSDFFIWINHKMICTVKTITNGPNRQTETRV